LIENSLIDLFVAAASQISVFIT